MGGKAKQDRLDSDGKTVEREIGKDYQERGKTTKHREVYIQYTVLVIRIISFSL